MKTKKTKKLSHTNQFARNIQLFKLFLCCLSCLTFLSHLREEKIGNCPIISVLDQKTAIYWSIFSIKKRETVPTSNSDY